MRAIVAWAILAGVFLCAGEGLNLFRIGIENWLAYGRTADALRALGGLVIAFVCTAFLGGFIYYRDKKRGRIKRRAQRVQQGVPADRTVSPGTPR